MSKVLAYLTEENTSRWDLAGVCLAVSIWTQGYLWQGSLLITGWVIFGSVLETYAKRIKDKAE